MIAGCIMRAYQAKGYYLEEIVRELMRKSEFIDVKTGNIEGRGANHQIDSYGTLMFTIPFVYPIRLISEVKWFSRNYKVQLNRLRSFVGVMIDISQNYFVPRAMRSRRQADYSVLRKERYTDSGAYFSATGFSRDAQDYAWAHGVYLIPFSQDKILDPILKRAQHLIYYDRFWEDSQSKKAEVIEKARYHFQADRELHNLMRRTFSYIGILDGLYPVILVSDEKFEFDPTAPDDLTEEDMSFESNYAFKERRIEGEEDVNFQFRFHGTRFSFSLPMVTAKKIIYAIESTYGGEAFATLDIPIVLKAKQRTYRRIFRIHLALPFKSDMIEAFKQTL